VNSTAFSLAAAAIYLRALLACMVGANAKSATRAAPAELAATEPAAPLRRRLRPSRRQLRRQAAGNGARRIDPSAGLVAQARRA
jgi:hypothetical protein